MLVYHVTIIKTLFYCFTNVSKEMEFCSVHGRDDGEQSSAGSVGIFLTSAMTGTFFFGVT